MTNRNIRELLQETLADEDIKYILLGEQNHIDFAASAAIIANLDQLTNPIACANRQVHIFIENLDKLPDDRPYTSEELPDDLMGIEEKRFQEFIQSNNVAVFGCESSCTQPFHFVSTLRDWNQKREATLNSLDLNSEIRRAYEKQIPEAKTPSLYNKVCGFFKSGDFKSEIDWIQRHQESAQLAFANTPMRIKTTNEEVATQLQAHANAETVCIYLGGALHLPTVFSPDNETEESGLHERLGVDSSRAICVNFEDTFKEEGLDPQLAEPSDEKEGMTYTPIDHIGLMPERYREITTNEEVDVIGPIHERIQP